MITLLSVVETGCPRKQRWGTIVLMMTVMVLVCFVVFLLLIGMSGIVPRPTRFSMFELERRKEKGDHDATTALRREELLIDVISLQRVLVALLLVVFVSCSVVTFGWLLGIILAVFVALEYGAIGRLGPVRRFSQKLYDQYEPSILATTQKLSKLLRLIRSIATESHGDRRVDSREELEHLVVTSGNVLTTEQKKLITHGLKFDTREVSEVMTPRGVIDSISKRELLGPLVLDDLHKTGHSRFPVVDGDIDHVVGMLHIQELLAIDSKRKSMAVEKAMEPRVFYIREDQTLDHALAAFLRTRHHLFVVINEFRETVGLVSLEDVIEALLGRRIVDEFDLHEDLRAIASHNPRGNNHPADREDV
jgi:CBS domain containing-hemolysin-like protein